MTPPATVRADLFADLLLVAPGVSWVGPVEWDNSYAPGGVQLGFVLPNGHVGWMMSDGKTVDSGPNLDGARLPLSRPECRAQLARVLAAGLKCDRCRGSGVVADVEGSALDCSCDDGWLRRPSDVRHLLPVAEMGTLPDAWAHFAPALLKAHAESVAGGGVGVQDILGLWRKACDDDPDTGAIWIRGRLLNPKNHGGGLWVCERVQSWRDFGWENSCVQGPDGMWLRGPETGDAGKAAADTSALAHGMALLDADGLRLPVGGGE